MRTSARPARRSRGFALIEVMVVIVILGVLAALVVPSVMSRPDEARVVAAKGHLGHHAGPQALQARQPPLPHRRAGPAGLVTVPPPRRCPTTGSPTSTSCPSTLGQALPVRHARPQGRVDVMSFGADGIAGGEGLRRGHRLLEPVSPRCRRQPPPPGGSQRGPREIALPGRRAVRRAAGFTLIEGDGGAGDHGRDGHRHHPRHRQPARAATPTRRCAACAWCSKPAPTGPACAAADRHRAAARRLPLRRPRRRRQLAPLIDPPVFSPNAPCPRPRLGRPAPRGQPDGAAAPAVRHPGPEYELRVATPAAGPLHRRANGEGPPQPAGPPPMSARRQRGFTLLETLVALAILAIALTAAFRAWASPPSPPPSCASAPGDWVAETAWPSCAPPAPGPSRA